MVISCIFVDVLLKTRQGSKWLDVTMLKIVLAFSNISCIVWYRVCYIVSRHSCDTENCNGSSAFKVDSLLISSCKLRVQVTRITSIGWNLVHSNGHFFQGICIVCHICQKYKYFLSLKCKLLGNSKR